MKILPLKKQVVFFAFTLFFIITTRVMAQIGDSSIIVKDVWVRPSQVENSAAYMTIENTGSVLDQLISVQTNACEWVELHRIEKVRSIFRMRPVESIDIPSETVTILRPAGMHLMLMKLKNPLKVGEKVILHLNFKKAGAMTVEAEVRHTHNKEYQRTLPQEKESPQPEKNETLQDIDETQAPPVSKG